MSSRKSIEIDEAKKKISIFPFEMILEIIVANLTNYIVWKLFAISSFS